MAYTSGSVSSFQSTLLCEERHDVNLNIARDMAFQSTLLCEERQQLYAGEQAKREFQSTLLCEERRNLRVQTRITSIVSIHAPV